MILETKISYMRFQIILSYNFPHSVIKYVRVSVFLNNVCPTDGYFMKFAKYVTRGYVISVISKFFR